MTVGSGEVCCSSKCPNVLPPLLPGLGRPSCAQFHSPFALDVPPTPSSRTPTDTDVAYATGAGGGPTLIK